VITGLDRFGCTQERLAGFADAYAFAGYPIDPALVVEGDFTFECGRRAVQRMLAGGMMFDAVFAHNDLSAAGALQGIREAGKGVPGDVAVVGFDDLVLAGHTEPPLSSVHQPLREMGETAARLLISHFEGVPLPDKPTVIPTTFTVRASTAIA
jgi:LacI family transcriptional regulator